MFDEVVTARATKRDHALDVVRGTCVVMMTFAHLAPESSVTWALHLPLWVDGASGFVLLSGVVLGMVQHGRLSRGGMAGAQTALARRVVMLYGAQVALVLLALVIGAGGLAEAPWLPPAGSQGGWPQAALRTLGLQVNPPGVDILSLYVVLLVLGMAALWLLRRGLLWLLAVLSLAVYAVAQAAPAAVTLPAGAGQAGFFTWGGWQLMFLSGFVAGWYWRSKDLPAHLASRRAAILGVVILLVIYGACVPVMYLDAAPALRGLVDDLVSKQQAGPLVVIIAWAVFVVAYAGLTQLFRVVSGRVLEPVATIGRRSLDGYIILTLLVILVPAAVGHVVGGELSGVAAGVAIVTMWGWAQLRDRRRAARSESRAVAQPVSAA